jgi:hypothetical protein
VRELVGPADLTRTLETDGRWKPAGCRSNRARLLEGEIWGQGFPAPLFSDEFEVEKQRILKDKHLKLTPAQGRRPLRRHPVQLRRQRAGRRARRLPPGGQRLQRRHAGRRCSGSRRSIGILIGPLGHDLSFYNLINRRVGVREACRDAIRPGAKPYR